MLLVGCQLLVTRQPGCFLSYLVQEGRVEAQRTACQISSGPVLFSLMEATGKFLQLAGLIVPPVSIIAQLNESISTKQMLVFLVAAASAFCIGRIVEGYSA